MEAYRNTNKPLSIKSIDSQGMILEDGSQWQFLGATPPPLSWQAGDQVVINRREGGIKSETMYGVVNKTRGDQDRSAVYLGGDISKDHVIEIKKSWEGYPNERLDRNMRVKDLGEEGCVELEDGSAWQLTGLTYSETGDWSPGQLACVSRNTAGVKTYRMKNVTIDKTFIVVFMGFRESKF